MYVDFGSDCRVHCSRLQTDEPRRSIAIDCWRRRRQHVFNRRSCDHAGAGQRHVLRVFGFGHGQHVLAHVQQGGGQRLPRCDTTGTGRHLHDRASFVHLLSNQVDGTTIPFKPGNTVLIYNGGLNTGLNNSGSPGMNLLGSPDLNTTLATGSYGAPLGPSGWVVIATLSGAPIPQLLTLGYDWIAASGSTGTVVMLQN